MTDLMNPMLDEDDEEEVSVTPRFSIRRPAEPVSAPAEVAKQPWEKPHRSPEEEARVEALKASGNVPTGKKKRRNSMTEKDAVLLAFLSVFRVATAEQLSLLLTTAGVHGNEAGKMASPKTVLNRLLRLREIGAVQDASIWAEQRIWGVTNFGRGAAIAYGLVERDSQIQPKGLQNLNYTELPHRLAVNWVAAQLLSPFGFYRDVLKLPQRVSFGMLRSEYEVNSAWFKVNQRLAAENKLARGGNGSAPVRSFKDWRSDMLREVHARVASGDLAYRDAADSEPGLWTLGQTPAPGDDMREHHLPDLVVDLERFRKNSARPSLAFEVELKAKSVGSYRKQLRMWAADLQQLKDYPAPLLYGRLIFVTNLSLVEERLREADEKEKLGLFESGKLRVLPLTGRDGKTPLSLTSHVEV